jgi:hypothetical protein
MKQATRREFVGAIGAGMAGLTPALSAMGSLLSMPKPPMGRFQGQQMFLVQDGVKECCRLKARRDDLPYIFDLVMACSLRVCVGHEAVAGKPVPGRSDYSEWSHRRPLSPTDRNQSYVYIAAERQTAERARRFDEGRNDTALGEILGYPTCCVRSFTGQLSRSPQDPLLAIAEDEGWLPWYLNTTLLACDIGLLAHIPCGYDCQRSVEIGMKYFESVWSADRGYATRLAASLCSTSLYTAAFGVVAFRGTRVAHNQLAVNTIVAATRDSLVAGLVVPQAVLDWDATYINVDSFAIGRDEARVLTFS